MAFSNNRLTSPHYFLLDLMNGQHNDLLRMLYDLALSIPVYAERLAQIRKEFRDDDPIVFTHGDLSMLNILVRVDGEGPEDVKVTAVLDWEQAGWRPIYWEGIKWWWMEGNVARLALEL